MKISVVIPTIGRPSLERAIDSVRAQTRRPLEIVVAANGHDPFVLDRWAGFENVHNSVPTHLLSLPPLVGPSTSRNVGAWHARGSLIAFLDDDDEFSPDYLEQMLLRFERTECDILYGAKVWPGDDGSPPKEKRLKDVSSDAWFAVLYRQQNPGFGGTNVMVRREVFFRLGGFPAHLPSGEDRAFAMKALRNGCRIEYVDEATVICHTPDGYRAKRRPDKWITNLRLIHKYWPDVTWWVRLRSVAHWLRSVPRPSTVRKAGQVLRRHVQ